ncbi:MAG: zinc-binding dehydrogenase [Actinomycetota bacterium]|nr:zinc-binding dehydrogenase [Actinomycetota bacterium]
MKALVFGDFPDPMPPPPADDAPRLVKHLASTPMQLRDVPDPELRGPDWAVLRTRLTGICGSDTKQVLMDFEGAADSPMTAFISFPQVLGHEVVATVEEAGPEAGVRAGQRVVLNPWLSCEVRGIDPCCPPCEAGDFSLCWRFLDGSLRPGIHTGNSADATGGFAELLPAHRRMMVPVPDDVPDEVAVLADPFSVALHAVTRTPPPRRGRVDVYGAGALGTCATAILRALYPEVRVATVARWDAQEALAADLGAVTFSPEPREQLIEELAVWSGGVLRSPWEGLPITWPGQIDVVYDTVGAPETLEVGLRVLAGRGSIVQLGLSSMDRCEWTPWYFKEARLVGSNAFGIEEVDGVRKHAMEHYLDLVRSGHIDLNGMLTHTFPLDGWREAFTTLIDQGITGAIKCAFDLR